MRIGYPCINRSLSCRSSRTFRLRSYSAERLVETVAGNLDCLDAILRFNAARRILFFRITSDLVPFASHPVCRVDWGGIFRDRFRALGSFIRGQGMRISMHPDQFTLLNSRDPDIFERSARELEYHARVLDLLGLDRTARIQIHVGGVYGDREASARRFVERFRRLDGTVRSRLAVENDHRHWALRDCLAISGETGSPVLFDSYHHQVLNHGEGLGEACRLAAGTWGPAEGPPMADYSSGKPGAAPGTHAEHIDIAHFRRFLRATRGCDMDVMLEIKDKERSALDALDAAAGDPRLVA